MLASEPLKEADRLMTICNSCRYCEGLCAVFPAMEARNTFEMGDLDYLANLCHGCGACYEACQFSPPHAFNVNVPATLAQLRSESYARYAWPPVAGRLLRRNGVASAAVASLSVAASMGFFFLRTARSVPVLAQTHHVISFYRQMPHSVMVLVFGVAFMYALLALSLSARRFWVNLGAAAAPGSICQAIWQALRDTGRLRYLDGHGGSVGCAYPDESIDIRRPAHHLVFYGFLLCFASTVVASLNYYVLNRDAPYAWYEVPVILGALGGSGMIIGSLLLFRAKRDRTPLLSDTSARRMDTAFLTLLILTAVSGLALLLFRNTVALTVLLSLHLGVVFGLFITIPYGKFVHGIYRFVALVRYARERKAERRM